MANEAYQFMGFLWWPKLEIRKGEPRSLTNGVRTRNKTPDLAKVQWMLLFAGWKTKFLVFMFVYSLVRGFSLSWSTHFDCVCVVVQCCQLREEKEAHQLLKWPDVELNRLLFEG